tara:strand:- start:1658 stop:1981 length:324 start_codon:yes stop_codon:yes gene_type:complete
MLVKSQYKTNDIICFRITTGEEIVAKLKIEDPNTYTVVKPLALVNGPKGVVMVPAMVTVDQHSEIIYNKSAIISTSTPTKAVVASYVENTSGLVMATGTGASKLKAN